MATITVSIGRNVGSTPLTEHDWGCFIDDVRYVLEVCAAEVHVDAARSVGEWEGVREDSATWVAGIAPDQYPNLRSRLSAVGRRYEQDAIAVTAGVTEFV